MIIPVRCFTCNKCIAHLWKPFEDGIKSGNDAKTILDFYKINRYCCRRMFIGNVNVIDKLVLYPTKHEN